jgi:hypothetical protein
MVDKLLFKHWAMPVTRKRWAFVSTLAGMAKRATSYKIRAFNTLDFYAWRKATA